MRRLPAVLVSALLVIGCLVLIGMQAGSPLLYSPRSDPGVPDHVNPAAQDMVTGDRAAQVLPLISDLLNTPGSLVLNIKGSDFEYAARDLQEYRQISRQLDSLVINLDMTEGELNEFRKANQQNLAILTELFNGTGRWDELQTLEIRYRDSGDSQMLTSITYEGEALRRRIQDLYRDYLDQDQVMRETGEKFGLDTSSYDRSISDFREIVSRIDENQDERMVTFTPAATPGERLYQLTLTVERERVSYMDTAVIRGLLFVHEKGKPDEVDLFIDSRRVRSISTNPDGSFSYSHLVEHDHEGTHTVFAVYSGSVFSEIRTFFVEREDTYLDLEPPVPGEGRVELKGTLMAGSTPVRSAPIEILADGKRAGTTYTGEDGKFSIGLKLSSGNRKVKVIFSADTFPLAPSESAVYEVLIPTPGPGTGNEESFLASPLHAAILAASVCASCVIAFFYLHRRRPGPKAPAPVFHLPGEPVPDPNEAMQEVLAEGATPAGGDLARPGDERPPGVDAPGDLPSLFSALRLAVSRHLAFLHPLSLTPRELCRISRDLAGPVRLLAPSNGYEQARYSGAKVPEDELDVIAIAASSAMNSLEGADH